MYRIFIFCISFFSASFLLAEKLPDTFELETIDVSKAYSFFNDLIKPKDEFETTKDYTERVKKQILNSSLLKGNSDQYFYVPLDKIDFRYDADKQEGSFSGVRIDSILKYKAKSDDLYRLTLKSTSSNHKSFMGENSFGVQKEISSWDADVDVIVFHNPRHDIVQFFWTKPMDVATAKAAKQNCKAAVRFKISPQDNAFKLVLFYDTDYKDPTIDSPYKVSTTYRGLYVESVSLIFYDEETKEIYWNIDLAEYKDRFTLEREAKIAEAEAKRRADIEKRQAVLAKIEAERQAEIEKLQAEKEAKEKREKVHAKKALEFFQDWETPKENFFGKYIKTQQNIVFFEKEDGTEVQVDLDDLSPQYQDLIKLAKTFKKVKAAILKPRMWDEPGTSYQSGDRKSGAKKRFKATFVRISADSESYRKELTLFLRLDNQNIRKIPLSRLSERDKKWFENTYNEFLKAKQHYEEKYSVRLLEE